MTDRSSWKRWLPSSLISIRRSTGNWSRVGLNLLIPPRCAHCEGDVHSLRWGLLCETCQNAMVPKQWNPCQRCGANIAESCSAVESCIHCRQDRLKFDTVVALGPYQDELRSALLLLKRLSGEPLAHPIGQMLYHHRGDWIKSLKPDLIIPIPMYWLRRVARGINSAEMLARQLGNSMGVSVESDMLIRCRNTLPQKNLARKQRFVNVHGAFQIRTGYSLQGIKALLVDDILTTGATCSEAARVLKQAGVDQVFVAVVGRAQGIEHAFQ